MLPLFLGLWSATAGAFSVNRDDPFLDGLQKRVNTLAESESFDEQLQAGSTVDVPVVCFDALLPRQTLAGSTTDPVFCTFLRRLGLGGSFAMISANQRQRKMRRHGVIARINLVDVDGDVDDCTAVTFSLVGRQRCEVLGPREAMAARIGRWRRGYDPDGEEAQLGWGAERFVDARGGDADGGRGGRTTEPSAPHREWSTSRVRIRGGGSAAEVADPRDVDHATRLVPLVERWVALASEPTTYDNVAVVAGTRRRAGEPGLRVDAASLLNKVQSELGEMPRPSQPSELALWVAALVNPLPPLGVATECRGAVLEAEDEKGMLEIVERTLVKSINNLTGDRPLNM